jgi:TPR repeat protein
MSTRRLSRWLAAGVIVFAIALAGASPALKALHLRWPAWLVAFILASLVALGGVVKPLVDACTQAWAKHLTAEIERGQRRRSLIAEVQGGDRNLRRVSEMTDRALLGIHPAIPLPQTTDGTLSEELPLYIPRDIDSDLQAWFEARRTQGGFLLLVGPAATGKTRCAYELLRTTVPDWSIFMPSAPSHVTEFSNTAYEGNTVIWLNEFKNFLVGEGLNIATVRRLLTDSRPVLLIGTIWQDDFDNFANSEPEIPEQAHITQDYRELLTVLAHRVNLPDVFSSSERHRASQLAERDPRIAEAISHPDSSNIATTLAAAPELIRRWIHGSNSYGRCVITAAVMARRCGHPQPIPEAVLHPMTETLLSNSSRAAAVTDWFPSALKWAAQVVRGESAPLTAQAAEIGKIDGYSVSDVLVQYANTLPEAYIGPIRDPAWRILIKNSTPYACSLIGFAAVVSNPQMAELALRKAAEAGCGPAMLGRVMARLGLLLRERGEDAEAEVWWRKVVTDAKDWTAPEVNAAVSGIGFLKLTHGEEVEEWWRIAAKAGNLNGMASLAEILHKRGDEAGAETWAAKAAEAGNFQGMACLAEILHKRGDETQAETWAAKAAEGGNLQGMAWLAEILRERGDETQAETWAAKAAEAKQTQDATNEAWWRKPAEAGNPRAMEFLAAMLFARGDHAEAETWWRAAAEAGNLRGMARLGLFLRERGENLEAETWWRKTVTAAKDWTTPETNIALSGVSIFIIARGEKVEEWWLAAAEHGNLNGMANLAEILHKRGDDREAETWATKAAERGNLNGMGCLAKILRKRGDEAGAETWAAKAAEAKRTQKMKAESTWRTAAQAGSPNGMAQLAEILRKRGDDRDAETWATKAAEAGNPQGMAQLAEILRKRGDDRDAETWATKAAEGGNPQGMAQLAEILRGRGESTKANTWAARAAELDSDVDD